MPSNLYAELNLLLHFLALSLFFLCVLVADLKPRDHDPYVPLQDTGMNS